MCDHFINNQWFKVYWFRGVLPFTWEDLNLFPVLANFFKVIEGLGGFDMVLNSSILFSKLSTVDQNIFNLLNEMVFRIVDTSLQVIGFQNIMKCFFNIDNVQLDRLLAATGIEVQQNYHKMSSSACRWKSLNTFARWGARLVFVGSRDFNTYSGATRYYST